MHYNHHLLHNFIIINYVEIILINLRNHHIFSIAYHLNFDLQYYHDHLYHNDFLINPTFGLFTIIIITIVINLSIK